MSNSTENREVGMIGGLRRVYDASFAGDAVYADTLPDMQNTATSASGIPVRIQEVGSSNFRVPVRVDFGLGDPISVEARVFGGVSLDRSKKGINMSRIIRIFYDFRDEVFGFSILRSILERYLSELDTDTAKLRLKFAVPMMQRSLRSGLDGYQYYEAVVSMQLGKDGFEERRMDLDFVYSSACPCSAELAEHAREGREIYSVPHSQRSKARVSVTVDPNGAPFGLRELRDLCARALSTETQVMVRRLDEQAFAELNGSHLKFVEDAARLLYRELEAEPAILDFQAACAHLESLHSHDAVATIFKGISGGFDGRDVDYDRLVC